MLLPVALTAWYSGLGPGLAATALCTVIAGVFFTPANRWATTGWWWQTTAFLAQGVLVSALAAARNRARAALNAAIGKSAAMLQGLTDAFASLDRDFRFTYANSAAEKLFGKSRGALRGMTLWEALPGLAGSPVEAGCRRAMQERQPISAAFDEHSGRRLEVRAYPSAGGELSVHFRDTTDRVQIGRASCRERVSMFV
jgi:PAS domain S-box-containing protein